MKKEIILLFIVFLAFSTNAKATSLRLTSDQIRQTLVGNTVIWNNDGLTQHQYFHTNGATVYQHQNQDVEEGRWLITKDNLMCTNWQTTQGWDCYQISLQDNKIIWNGPVVGYRPADLTITTPQNLESRLERGNKTVKQYDDVSAIPVNTIARLQN